MTAADALAQTANILCFPLGAVLVILFSLWIMEDSNLRGVERERHRAKLRLLSWITGCLGVIVLGLHITVVWLRYLMEAGII